MGRRSDRVEERLDMVRRFEESSLTATEFARREGVSVGTLANWRRRAAENLPPPFLPVTVLPARTKPRDQGAAVARVLVGDVTLEVLPGADAIELAALVRALVC